MVHYSSSLHFNPDHRNHPPQHIPCYPRRGGPVPETATAIATRLHRTNEFIRAMYAERAQKGK